jgi:hypothetical protein
MKTILTAGGLLILHLSVCGQGSVNVNVGRSNTFPVLTVPHVGPYVPSVYIPVSSNEPVTYIVPVRFPDLDSLNAAIGSSTTLQIRVWTESANTAWNSGALYDSSLNTGMLFSSPNEWFHFGFNTFTPWLDWSPPKQAGDVPVVPEPASYVLAGLGLVVLLGFYRRR